ncbi:hypothetical protein MMC20_001163 [Loxospora ochrophaea]|nr:hypothetical protein [Loxospora ochrophaea]
MTYLGEGAATYTGRLNKSRNIDLYKRWAELLGAPEVSGWTDLTNLIKRSVAADAPVRVRSMIKVEDVFIPGAQQLSVKTLQAIQHVQVATPKTEELRALKAELVSLIRPGPYLRENNKATAGSWTVQTPQGAQLIHNSGVRQSTSITQVLSALLIGFRQPALQEFIPSEASMQISNGAFTTSLINDIQGMLTLKLSRNQFGSIEEGQYYFKLDRTTGIAGTSDGTSRGIEMPPVGWITIKLPPNHSQIK